MINVCHLAGCQKSGNSLLCGVVRESLPRTETDLLSWRDIAFTPNNPVGRLSLIGGPAQRGR